MSREITIAGAGTGATGQVTPEVMRALCDSDAVFSSRRFSSLIPAGKNVHDVLDLAALDRETGKVLILVSGDPGIFSLLPAIKRRCPRDKITVLPGISSLQAICAHAAETWSDAAILSGHGRTLSPGKFLNTVERNRITVLFCDRNISPSWACEELAFMNDVEVFIGSCLGSESESIHHGRPGEFSGSEFPELSILLVRNNSVYTPERQHLWDKDFLRAEGIVMTNEAVRAVILSRLEVNDDATFWDIGAGSGSISVSVGHEVPFSDVHAVELNPKASSLISRNAAKFHLHNITVHNSRALEVIDALPSPSCVFIGGSNGELPGILAHISAMNEAVHVVVACVTLETFTEAFSILKDWEDFEALQVSASSSRALTPELTMMKASNPVMILSARK